MQPMLFPPPSPLTDSFDNRGSGTRSVATSCQAPPTSWVACRTPWQRSASMDADDGMLDMGSRKPVMPRGMQQIMQADMVVAGWACVWDVSFDSY